MMANRSILDLQEFYIKKTAIAWRDRLLTSQKGTRLRQT